MACFIFLKYLRSLEEFRKNPHIKIPPKSPCANFQSLDIFKIQFYSEKNFSVAFGPAATHLLFFSTDLFPSPLGLSLSASPSRPLGLADRAPVVPCRIAASHTGRRLQPHRLCPLRARLTGGPHLSSLASGSA
jgi:hypothetical protein